MYYFPEARVPTAKEHENLTIICIARMPAREIYIVSAGGWLFTVNPLI